MKHSAGWTDHGDRLVRSFRFRTFAEAMGFMMEVALYCEKADHHPDWRNIYNRIDVILTTHDAGGVTEKDWALAAHMDEVFRRYSALK